MLSSQEKREIWLKDAISCRDLLEDRAAKTIEMHRKGYCRLKITDANGNPLPYKEIKISQISHDFKFGANIFMLDEFKNEKDNTTYRENFKKYFNLATVPFYWDGLEPEKDKPRYNKNSPGVYRRPSPDLCVEYCSENNIDYKLHCLVYDKFIPSWLPKNDMLKMEKLYEKRFAEIAKRYSGFWEIEVINELLCEHTWKTQSVISDKKDIIEWAFALANKYFPKNHLVINEGNPINSAAREDWRSPYYILVENALLKGVKIDKIGLQHHQFCGATAKSDEEYTAAVKRGSKMFDPYELYKGLDTFAALGLPLELTEVTIPTFGETAEDEELQADLLEILYTVCFGHSSVDAVVYWNVPDGYAYAPSGSNWDENACRGGLWHHDLTPKKSAERLFYLFNKKWHTDLTIMTNQDGFAEFKGFFGEYSIEFENKTSTFAIRKNETNNYSLEF